MGTLRLRSVPRILLRLSLAGALVLGRTISNAADPADESQPEGLRGMRERARLMGGKLTVWSALESGAEVELSIPAARAYATSASTWRSWFAKKLSGESVKSDS